MTLRRIFCYSTNPEMQRLYKKNSCSNVRADEIINKVFPSQINNYKGKKKCSLLLQKSKIDKIWEGFCQLKEQNIIIKEISAISSHILLSKWQKTAGNLPNNIYNFIRRSLVISLPTNSNMNRCNKHTDDKCSLCSQQQTQPHVLSNCKVALHQRRYTWRHDSILATLGQHLMASAERGFKSSSTSLVMSPLHPYSIH